MIGRAAAVRVGDVDYNSHLLASSSVPQVLNRMDISASDSEFLNQPWRAIENCVYQSIKCAVDYRNELNYQLLNKFRILPYMDVGSL